MESRTGRPLVQAPHLQWFEACEVAVVRKNGADAMLSAERANLSVEHQVAARIRLAGDSGGGEPGASFVLAALASALAFLQSFSAASEYAPRFTVPSDPGITKPFWRIQLDAAHVHSVVVLDCDDPEALLAAQDRCALPVPNWRVLDPVTQHEHVAYALQDPPLASCGVEPFTPEEKESKSKGENDELEARHLRQVCNFRWPDLCSFRWPLTLGPSWAVGGGGKKRQTC